MVEDACATAELVRTGQASPAEMIDAAIERIEKLNPELNAVIVDRFEQARKEAAGDLPDGPLRGVPWVVKDLDVLIAGSPHFGGIRGVRDAGYTARDDSVLVERLRAAGAVCVGKTNTPELGLIPTTEPEAFGPSRNPHDPTRSTGGSSGGSAAAVASGMVPIGHANDGGGSIRIPASECGLVGLKPSRGRIPQWPEAAEFWAGLVMQGFVTRTVRDTALLYEITTGPATGDLHTPPDLPVEDRPLRIGLHTSVPEVPTTDPECVAAVERAARLLEDAGHVVEAAHPQALADPAVINWFLPCYAAWTAHDLDMWGTRIGRPLTADDVELLTWSLAEMGRTLTAAQYLDALHGLHGFSRRVQSWWDEGWDLLLTPTIPEVPPVLGSFASTPDNPLGGAFRAALVIPFCVPFNITGQPAISLPLHRTDDGLPVGVQLVARYGADRLLLRLAADLLAT